MQASPRNSRGFLHLVGLLLVAAMVVTGLQMAKSKVAAAQSEAAAAGFALRLFGTGSGGVDRVRFPLDAPERPIDVGAGSFTIEFWLKASLAENGGSGSCGSNDGWITANTILDRDIYFAGDYGDFGIGLSNGLVIFGLSVGSGGTTVCGNTLVADGAWHHVAVTRDGSSGELRIFVDGQPDGSRTGPTGDASYRNGRSSSYANDPFLVLGAEKHDAGSEYPSFSGFFDEMRISNVNRYAAAFARPSAPFGTDGSTVGLYHFDEGPAGACTGVVTDASGAPGGPSNGQCIHGGSPQSGPLYVTETPFGASATPVPTNTSVPPTSTPAPTTVPATSTPAPPPTLTPTPEVDDLIFASSFEAGGLSEWSRSVVDGGDLAVTSSTDLVGGKHLSALIDDNRAIYVEDNSPANEIRYRARFYFDPKSLEMAPGNRLYIFAALAPDGTMAARLEMRRTGTSYEVRGQVRTDRKSYLSTLYYGVSDAPHYIEVEWVASGPGEANGALELWIDNLPRTRLVGVDNGQQRIDRVRLGAVGGVDTGTRGTLRFDAFESRRQRFIGPVSLSGPQGSPPPGSGRAGGDGGGQTYDATPASSEVTIAGGVTTTVAVSGSGARASVALGPDGGNAGNTLRLSHATDYFLPGRLLPAAGPFEVEILNGEEVAAATAATRLDVQLQFAPVAAGVPVVMVVLDPGTQTWVRVAVAAAGADSLRASPNRPVLFAAAVDAAAFPVQLQLPLVRLR